MDEPAQPRTVTGKRPSAASVLRQREYLEWVAELPQGRDDERDESWTAFMAERRRRQEKLRLANVEERRRAARAAAPQRRGRPVDPSSQHQRRLAEQARLSQEDPAVRAQRQRDSDAAAIEAKVTRWCEIWRRRDEARCEAMLTHVPDEQRAEAERLFWEHARLLCRDAVADKLRRSHNRLGRCPDLAQARQEAHAAAVKLQSFVTGETPTPAWDTEGQCEGRTRCGRRCKVHRSCRLDVADPLRRGERFCGHHHPSKYTGVRCSGIKKHGKGQCRVWSGSCYADAAPLRRGSLYCHHHRVQCRGQTRAGVRCTVTSSSQHEHAAPLRQGEQFCAHHQHPASNANPCDDLAITHESIEAPASAQGERGFEGEEDSASVAWSAPDDDSDSSCDPSSGGWGSVEYCCVAGRHSRDMSREYWE